MNIDFRNDLSVVSGDEEYLKAMWEGQSNVVVAVRVRPLMKHDIIKKNCVRVLDGKVVVLMDPTLDKQDILRQNRSREKQYAFDFAFDQNSSQEEVYNKTTKFLIHGVLDGYNATVFAYGQTGSGKTHTMIGNPSDNGIMVRVMEDLFAYSASIGEQLRYNYKVTVSFLEVYNENIRDLLSEVEEYLDLREDPIKGPVVAGITEVEAKSSFEIMQLLHQGNARRSQAATAANEVSSRSHAVFQVVVENADKAPGVVANIKVGKLSLVDLAGSERAANTKNTGARLVEGANINRSLLALGNCINALGEKGNKGNFVPYRDSKLTRLLKDSLGGNCRTVMIATISSAESSFEETQNTLKYANRAKNIKTNAQRNVLNVNYHISEYVQLITNLRAEIKILKDQLVVNETPTHLALPPSSSTTIIRRRSYRDLDAINNNNSSSNGNCNDYGDVHEVVAVALSSTSIANENKDFGSGNNSHINIDGNSLPLISPLSTSHSQHRNHPATPLQMLRESMKSVTGDGRSLVNQMREQIVGNFQEKMQLRRSLIELEDQNVQNSIEISKRQLIVVQWTESSGQLSDQTEDFSEELLANNAPDDIRDAWLECEQLRKAVLKNNAMKKNIGKRLRHNEKEAEKLRNEMSSKITGEDRRELMELQYQVGRLELENMELEQHRIVHESILKGKDLTIQKLQLQLAVRDKIIQRQQNILVEHNLDHLVGYGQLSLLEQSIMRDVDLASSLIPPSPPRTLSEVSSMIQIQSSNTIAPGNTINHSNDKKSIPMTHHRQVLSKEAIGTNNILNIGVQGINLNIISNNNGNNNNRAVIHPQIKPSIPSNPSLDWSADELNSIDFQYDESSISNITVQGNSSSNNNGSNDQSKSPRAAAAGGQGFTVERKIKLKSLRKKNRLVSNDINGAAAAMNPTNNVNDFNIRGNGVNLVVNKAPSSISANVRSGRQYRQVTEDIDNSNSNNINMNDNLVQPSIMLNNRPLPLRPQPQSQPQQSQQQQQSQPPPSLTQFQRRMQGSIHGIPSSVRDVENGSLSKKDHGITPISTSRDHHPDHSIHELKSDWISKSSIISPVHIHPPNIVHSFSVPPVISSRSVSKPLETEDNYDDDLFEESAEAIGFGNENGMATKSDDREDILQDIHIAPISARLITSNNPNTVSIHPSITNQSVSVSSNDNKRMNSIPRILESNSNQPSAIPSFRSVKRTLGKREGSDQSSIVSQDSSIVQPTSVVPLIGDVSNMGPIITSMGRNGSNVIRTKPVATFRMNKLGGVVGGGNGGGSVGMILSSANLEPPSITGNAFSSSLNHNINSSNVTVGSNDSSSSSSSVMTKGRELPMI